MKKLDFGDIIEVVILLVVLLVGFFYTVHGFFGGDFVSSSYNRYYEAHEDSCQTLAARANTGQTRSDERIYLLTRSRISSLRG